MGGLGGFGGAGGAGGGGRRPCYTVPCAHRMACPLAWLRSPLPGQCGVRRGCKRTDEEKFDSFKFGARGGGRGCHGVSLGGRHRNICPRL